MPCLPPPPVLPLGLWTCRLPPPGWRMETWAPDTPGSPSVLSSRVPSGFGICSGGHFRPPHRPLLQHPFIPQPSSLGLMSPGPLPPECVLGGRKWGGAGPSSVREVGMGAGPWLPVVHRPGALGGISLATPTPQGRGRSPGESQAWGGSPRVRRGGRSFVTKVRG